MRPEKDGDLPQYLVIIDEVGGGEIANVLRGYIEVKGEKIRFMGIAYGRYGGQNVAPRLSPASKKRLRTIFGELSRFEEDLQMKLVRGDLEIKPRVSAQSPE